MVEARRGRPTYDLVETSGFATALIGACFDPVNSVALLVPWIFDDVPEPTPFKHVTGSFTLHV
jgi:hypothetical protein